ncbi:hemerythrin domain-containing protein [Methylomarinum vadi]|uniref:hemerythrin domain-containing protein n=1 Tax=Methylomarinum vadi TaxID=438855 RepID=UPI00068D2DD4|nr:hemerythrin domain-containing protein [Methylomarinum vadi]
MRILLVSSAFSGLTQRFYTELKEAGYTVSVELHSGDSEQLMEGVALFKPDLIICPFLTHRIPNMLFESTTCLIVHPGIKGDRGPSSLDWAIQNGVGEWGVTLLEAREEMDAGDIWTSKTFPMRLASKSSIFNREVTQAAIDCLWEALTYFEAPDFKPEPLDYTNPNVKGKLLPFMKQPERAIDWKRHRTNEVLRRIHAADGSPGLLDEIHGQPFYLFNAHQATGFNGKPGEIIATTEHAICRATVDGAVWIGHLQPKLETGKGIKLPATMALQNLIPEAEKTHPIKTLFGKNPKKLDIDYLQPGRQLPFQEVWYEVEEDVAYLHFAFHNGGMSTAQCRLLLKVYRHVATLEAKVIVLMGGTDSWSNGIHLNHIENSENPADESWANINAIDDLIYQIITTLDKVTIAAVAGNAGAGGAILAIAPDKVFVRAGVVFNPHYKNMGELYGSEYWTYLLPKRVGLDIAMDLTEQRLPIGSKKAWQIGLVDKVLDKQHEIFYAQVKHLAKTYCADSEALRNWLDEKARIRCFDESNKALSSYRQFELTQMYANFYGNEQYHQARKKFVYKLASGPGTPLNIATHRQTPAMTANVSPGSLGHFIWQDVLQVGNEQVDKEHRDVFILANKLFDDTEQMDRLRHIEQLLQHVQEHFSAEEKLMKKSKYAERDEHCHEHRMMLKHMEEMKRVANQQAWTPLFIENFMNTWSKHILHSDIKLSGTVKNQPLIAVN